MRKMSMRMAIVMKRNATKRDGLGLQLHFEAKRGQRGREGVALCEKGGGRNKVPYVFMKLALARPAAVSEDEE
jgi:hypothetical protein